MNLPEMLVTPAPQGDQRLAPSPDSEVAEDGAFARQFSGEASRSDRPQAEPSSGEATPEELTSPEGEANTPPAESKQTNQDNATSSKLGATGADLTARLNVPTLATGHAGETDAPLSTGAASSTETPPKAGAPSGATSEQAQQKTANLSVLNTAQASRPATTSQTAETSEEGSLPRIPSAASETKQMAPGQDGKLLAAKDGHVTPSESEKSTKPAAAATQSAAPAPDIAASAKPATSTTTTQQQATDAPPPMTVVVNVRSASGNSQKAQSSSTHDTFKVTASGSDSESPRAPSVGTPVNTAEDHSNDQRRSTIDRIEARSANASLNETSAPNVKPPPITATSETLDPIGPRVQGPTASSVTTQTATVSSLLSSGTDVSSFSTFTDASSARANSVSQVSSLAPGTPTAGGASFVERTIAPQLTAAAATRNTGGVVDVMLDPPELGRVEIMLDLSDQGLRATLSAERQATVDLLRRNLDILGQQFEDAGFSDVELDMGSFAGSFADPEGQSNDEAKSDRGGFVENNTVLKPLIRSTGVSEGLIDIRL